MLWILVDGQPVRTLDSQAWARWFDTADRLVAQTAVNHETTVSTVFLGLDHNWGETDKPVLWETLVFGGRLDGEIVRYTSRADAEAGHLDMVAWVQRTLRRITPL